jgi:CHRD domain
MKSKLTVVRYLSPVVAMMGALMLPISASLATIITYGANLSGPAESPPNASPGTGSATVITDDVANTLSVDVSFSGLLAGTTASHIHCCTTAPFTGTAIVAKALATADTDFGHNAKALWMIRWTGLNFGPRTTECIAQCLNLEHEFRHIVSKLCILGFEPLK